jgi:hypothetical protein
MCRETIILADVAFVGPALNRFFNAPLVEIFQKYPSLLPEVTVGAYKEFLEEPL